MVQNLTYAVAANTTQAVTTSNYDLNLAAIIAAIALGITITGIIYKLGHLIGEIKGIKQVVDANFETLSQKYIMSEKIHNIELEVKRLSTETTNEKEVVKEHVYSITNLLYDKSNTLESRCEKLEIQIKSLEDEMKAHNEHHPPKTHNNMID
jgi:hypothetical protein